MRLRAHFGLVMGINTRTPGRSDSVPLSLFIPRRLPFKHHEPGAVSMGSWNTEAPRRARGYAAKAH